MKAIVHTTYGPPDVLELREIDRRAPKVAKLQPGQNVLVNGASGGVGTFAVQIATAAGAEVTGVCGSANADLVRELGARHVIDYTREDFTSGARRYDVILDNVENRSLADCRRLLTPAGTIILNNGTSANGFTGMVRLTKPLLLSPFARQNLRRHVAIPKHQDLADLTELLEAGKVRAVIGRVFPLAETPAALRHVETGHARGKVVIAVAD
jgi:NADPH:quinone reductase-like Zn-dependent oxidoreductase